MPEKITVVADNTVPCINPSPPYCLLKCSLGYHISYQAVSVRQFIVKQFKFHSFGGHKVRTSLTAATPVGLWKALAVSREDLDFDGKNDFQSSRNILFSISHLSGAYILRLHLLFSKVSIFWQRIELLFMQILLWAFKMAFKLLVLSLDWFKSLFQTFRLSFQLA